MDDEEPDIYGLSAERLRSFRPGHQRIVVLFCDGGSKPHDPTPISIYRWTESADWHPIHTAFFRDAEIRTGDNAIVHLYSDTELIGALADRAQEISRLASEAGSGEHRSQYRWRCPAADCNYDLIANDVDVMHRVFAAYAPVGEVSLAAIEGIMKHAARRG